MRIDIVTLFPELFTPFLKTGVTRRAFEGAMQVKLWQLRDFSSGNYRRVDDRPFGGGPGMVMQAEPLAFCLEAIWEDRLNAGIDSRTEAQTQPQPQSDSNHAFMPLENSRFPHANTIPVVLFSPVGAPLQHATAQRWAHSPTGGIWICGRYEGLDQRFIDQFVTEQISLGDFVLSGGEIAALALLDASARLLPGVLQNELGHAQDSFNPEIKGLLDCPHYTRPEIWRGQVVPTVLLSGDHAAIAQWRQAQRLALTQRYRPDLLPRDSK